MANRTFRVYGQAYAETGDVTAVLTVGGVEVFNGALAHSDNEIDGQPTVSDLQFQFELDENTTGELVYSLEVTNGEFALGRTTYNGSPGDAIVTNDWFSSNAPDATNVSAAAQTHIANTLGELKLGSTLYDALIAGSVPTPTDSQINTIQTVNHPIDFTVFREDNDVRTNALIDGEAIDGWSDDNDESFWPIIPAGSTFTCTWNLDPTSNHLASE